ncbi:carboxypeptidase regulatory-like domain-containing protein [Aquisphaera insulae]|uniref:carboxypeptidase regulatory-like domain-containing protein n=1 Tax=Aquisphaera insulae TaxID=2712864 RepID=UPI00202ED2A3|nr:carboxypeptidase regulatory-like domain-containing protein [Aquisphaera insulae]
MRVLRFTRAALSFILVAGCGSGDETESYTLTRVTGTVTLDGKPLDGAKVIFTPQGNRPDTPGSDMTGREGTYTIMYRGRAGVAKGKYSVLVAKTIQDGTDGAAPDAPGEFSESAALAAMKKQADLTADSVKRVARKTRPVSVSQTFDREVGDRATVLDFDLKKP